jgi:hypothetical protein
MNRLLSVAAIFALGWFASRIGRPDPLRRLHTTGDRLFPKKLKHIQASAAVGWPTRLLGSVA